MLKLSKKADLYNADSILYCLSKGPQSNADNIVGPGFNNSTVTDYLIGDPVVTNGNFDYVGYGSTSTHFSILLQPADQYARRRCNRSTDD